MILGYLGSAGSATNVCACFLGQSVNVPARRSRSAGIPSAFSRLSRTNTDALSSLRASPQPREGFAVEEEELRNVGVKDSLHNPVNVAQGTDHRRRPGVDAARPEPARLARRGDSSTAWKRRDSPSRCSLCSNTRGRDQTERFTLISSVPFAIVLTGIWPPCGLHPWYSAYRRAEKSEVLPRSFHLQ